MTLTKQLLSWLLIGCLAIPTPAIGQTFDSETDATRQSDTPITGSGNNDTGTIIGASIFGAVVLYAVGTYVWNRYHTVNDKGCGQRCDAVLSEKIMKPLKYDITNITIQRMAKTTVVKVDKKGKKKTVIKYTPLDKPIGVPKSWLKATRGNVVQQVENSLTDSNIMKQNPCPRHCTCKLGKTKKRRKRITRVVTLYIPYTPLPNERGQAAVQELKVDVTVRVRAEIKYKKGKCVPNRPKIEA